MQISFENVFLIYICICVLRISWNLGSSHNLKIDNNLHMQKLTFRLCLLTAYANLISSH